MFPTATPKPTSPTSRYEAEIANRLPGKLEKPSILELATLNSAITQRKCTFHKYLTPSLEQIYFPISLTKW